MNIPDLDVENRPEGDPVERALVLLSGGLDSTVALVLSKEKYEVVFALTFNYGQRALQQELAASEKIASHYQVPHRIIALPWLEELLPQALTPTSKLSGELSTESRPGVSEHLQETARVWVPNRNGLFLNIAATLAEASDISVVVFGANADEAIGFPDNTQDFRERLNECLSYSTLSQVRVETPVGAMTKAEMIRQAVERNIPLNLIWSCYEGDEHHCGRCPSCQLLKQALTAAESSETAATLFSGV